MPRINLTPEDEARLSPQEMEALMDCSCVYASDSVAELPSQIDEKTLPSGRLRCCDECGYEIMPGETYTRTIGRWDGQQLRFDTCVCCRSIIDTFFCDTFTHLEVWSDLKNHIEEMHGEVSSLAILSLSPRARDRVFHLIEQVWAELDEDEAADE